MPPALVCDRKREKKRKERVTTVTFDPASMTACSKAARLERSSPARGQQGTDRRPTFGAASSAVSCSLGEEIAYCFLRAAGCQVAPLPCLTCESPAGGRPATHVGAASSAVSANSAGCELPGATCTILDAMSLPTTYSLQRHNVPRVKPLGDQGSGFMVRAARRHMHDL